MSTRRPRITALLITALLVTALPMTAAAARPVKPPPPGPTVLDWSGHQWQVKQHSRKIGPGPNFFSSGSVEVRGDELHLKITRSGNRWYAAEVINTESFGYGTYTWTVGPMAKPLDPQVVLGLFTWNDDPAYNHREIDFEYAKWGNAGDTNNAQYVVQPYSTEGNEYRWRQEAVDVSTVHSFTWAPGSVEFRSTTASGAVLEEWIYDGPDVPVAGGEHARMNLWLFRGAAPQDGQSVTVVLESFSWEPLAP